MTIDRVQELPHICTTDGEESAAPIQKFEMGERITINVGTDVAAEIAEAGACGYPR